MPEINDNDTMPRPVLPPPGAVLDADDWKRATAASGAGIREGLPEEASRRAMARRAAQAPPYGQPPGPAGDGVLTQAEQLRGRSAELPPAWPPGETAADINARRLRPGRPDPGHPGAPV